MEKVLESNIKDYLIKQAKYHGFLCLKFTSPGRNGVPDRVVIGHGVTAFIELKRPTGATRALQNAVIRKMRRYDAWVYRANTKRKIDEILLALKINRTPDYLKKESPMKTLTTKKKETIIKGLIKLLEKEEVFLDVIIYYDNRRIFSETSKQLALDKTFDLKVEENINVEDYIEYGNPDTITVSFEGPMYLAYNENPRFFEKIDKFFKKYGLYVEQGYSWSLSCYFE